MERIVLSRELIEDILEGNLQMLVVFIRLLLMADSEGDVETSRRELAKVTGVPEYWVRKAIEKLEQKQVVRPLKTHISSHITICDIRNYSTLKPTKNPLKTQQREDILPHTPTLEEREKEERKKDIYNISQKEKEKEDPYEKIMAVWLEYKKAKRQSYKSAASVIACKKKLIRLSDNDPITANLIVEQSMANNWDGLFPLKTETRYGTDRKTSQEELDRSFRSHIAEKLGLDWTCERDL